MYENTRVLRTIRKSIYILKYIYEMLKNNNNNITLLPR